MKQYFILKYRIPLSRYDLVRVAGWKKHSLRLCFFLTILNLIDDTGPIFLNDAYATNIDMIGLSSQI